MNSTIVVDGGKPKEVPRMEWFNDHDRLGFTYTQRVFNYSDVPIVVCRHDGVRYTAPITSHIGTEYSGNILIRERYEFPKDLENDLFNAANDEELLREYTTLQALKEIIENGSLQRELGRTWFELESTISVAILKSHGSVYHCNSNLLFSSNRIDKLPPHPGSRVSKEKLDLFNKDMMMSSTATVLKIEFVDNEEEYKEDVYLATSSNHYLKIRPVRNPGRENGIHIWEKEPGAQGLHFCAPLKDLLKLPWWEEYRLCTTYAEVQGITNITEQVLASKESEALLAEHTLRLRELERKLTTELAKENNLKLEAAINALKSTQETKKLEREEEIQIKTHESKKEELGLKSVLAIATAVVGIGAIVKKILF